jgi:hypothetical protein
LLLEVFPRTAPGEALPLQTILDKAESNANFGSLWTGLKRYKEVHVDALKKNGGKGRKSIPTPEAAAAKCLRASLKFKYLKMSKEETNN